MLTSSQITRSVVVAATAMTIGASPALARQADTPARSTPTVTIPAPRHWTQARVESVGIRPVGGAVATSAPAAAPAAQPADGSAGLQWLLLPFAALALGLALVVAVARGAWHRADAFRARHV
jgi:hypothetical protein